MTNAQIWATIFIFGLFALAKCGLKITLPKAKKPTKKKIGRDKASKMIQKAVEQTEKRNNE